MKKTVNGKKEALKIKPKGNVDRTWDGIREALFDEMDELRSAHPRPDISNSVARQAAEIAKSVQIQMNAVKFGGGKGRPLLLP